MMKKTICLGLAVMAVATMFGCAKEPDNQAMDITIEPQADEVAAYLGQPDENGYYTIDQPRSKRDTVVLSEINNRLYFASMVMANDRIKEFKEAPSQLIWKTMAMEISFNYGTSSPFVAKSDGTGTLVPTSALDDLVKKCFYITGEIDKSAFPDTFKVVDDKVDITYGEIDSSAPGFMMISYRQQDESWYVKGEIIGEGNTIYTSGEFHLESISDGGPVLYRIKSFTTQ